MALRSEGAEPENGRNTLIHLFRKRALHRDEQQDTPHIQEQAWHNLCLHNWGLSRYDSPHGAFLPSAPAQLHDRLRKHHRRPPRTSVGCHQQPRPLPLPHKRRRMAELHLRPPQHAHHLRQFAHRRVLRQPQPPMVQHPWRRARLYDEKNDNFVRIRGIEGQVYFVCEDSLHNIWVSTDIGLIKMPDGNENGLVHW